MAQTSQSILAGDEAFRLVEKSDPIASQAHSFDELAACMKSFYLAHPALFAKPFLDLLIENDRSVFENSFAQIPEHRRSKILDKFKIFVPKKLTRRFTFWVLGDGSGFMRIESPNWNKAGALFAKIKANLPEDISEEMKAALNAQLDKTIGACAAKEILTPLDALAMAIELRGLAEPGELALNDFEWQPGVAVHAFPAVALQPSHIAKTLESARIASTAQILAAAERKNSDS